MGCPSARLYNSAVFWLSLLGIVGSTILLAWAWKSKLELGDHVDLAVPGGEGYLCSGSLGLAAVLTAPVHVLGLMLVRESGGKPDRLLFLHALLSCLSGLLLLGACAGSAYFWSLSRRRLHSGLQRAIRRYPSEPRLKPRVDRLQIELACCGAESYADWFLLNWKQLARDSTRDVPYSCCSPEAPRACVHESIARVTADEEDQLTISSEGCEKKLLRRADRASRRLLLCLLLSSAYQLTLSILSRRMLIRITKEPAEDPRASYSLHRRARA